MYAFADDQVFDFSAYPASGASPPPVQGPVEGIGAALPSPPNRRVPTMVFAQVVGTVLGTVMAAAFIIWSGATAPNGQPTRVAAIERAILDPDMTGSLPSLLRSTFPD